MYKTAQRDVFDQVAGQLSHLMNQLWQGQFRDFSSTDSWSPAINVYRFERRIEMCLDLAGLDPKAVDVRIEEGRLIVRGIRPAPEPAREAGEPMCIVSMEIDHGPFGRIINLPQQIDSAKASTHYHEGLLWIRLPFRDPG